MGHNPVTRLVPLNPIGALGFHEHPRLPKSAFNNQRSVNLKIGVKYKRKGLADFTAEEVQGMLRGLQHRIQGPGEPTHRTLEAALLAAGLLIATLLAILILFLGVFATRAI